MEVNLTNLSEEQLLAGLADTVLGLLRKDRVVLLVARPDGALTFINPVLLQQIPAESLATTLLENWEPEDVVSILEHIYG